ncbi:MAG TPA: BTAD domain-containing putative transcriptional regulator [Gaiellaceae bacterium]
MTEFRVLGPLEILDEGEPIAIGGRKQRMVLAMLLLEAGRVVSSERLIDAIWGEEPPRTATTSLQNSISRLRKQLGPDALITRPPGYQLNIEPEQLDLARCRRWLDEARGAEPVRRGELLRSALELWRGTALDEFAREPFAQAEVASLEELRLTVIEQRIDADIAAGRHSEVAGELETLVAEYPLREQFRSQLMLSLYHAGRQADALRYYQEGRQTLVDELGLEPSPALKSLHGAILRQELAADSGESVGPGEDHFSEVAAALAEGRVVPVVGVDHSQLAQALASHFGLESDGDLARVSQYVEVTKGSGPLYDELHSLLAATSTPGPVHRFLAALPRLAREQGGDQPLLVTAACDLALEQALLDAGEEFDVVTYIAAGRYRGRFCHLTPDGVTTPIESPNSYVEQLALDRRPVVLKLYGCVDPNPGRQWESFVVSEDDYIGYLQLRDLAAAVPVALAARLRRSHFLFLGYEMSNWHLRIVLNRLWENSALRYRSWAVLGCPAPLERELWRRRDVEVLENPPEEYVERLAERAGIKLEKGSK